MRTMTNGTVIITHYKVISWAYVKIIPLIRSYLDVNFILLLPVGSSVPREYKEVLDSKDQVIHVPNLSDIVKSNQFDLSDTSKISSLERIYNFNFYEDVLLQERSIASQTMVGSIEKKIPFAASELESIYEHACTLFFKFFENIFAENKICLSLVWPRSMWEAVIGIISTKNDILVTYPYTSKGEGNLVHWADGMFANSVELKSQFPKQCGNDLYNIKKRTLPGRPERYSHDNLTRYYSASYVARRIFLQFINWTIFTAGDVKRMNFTKRKNPISFSLLQLKTYFYWKKFISMCLKNTKVDLSVNYGLFSFQNEPEFSVQGRCKEFFNQQAIVLSIADAMPSGCVLFIKEHAWIGHRRIEYYEDILRHPNIQMISPAIPASMLIENAKFVASLNGTTLFEAAAYGVPAAYFSLRSEFSVLSNTFYFSDMLALKTWVKDVMAGEITISNAASRRHAENYMNVVRELSFEGQPLYNEGVGEFGQDQVARSVRLLLNKLKFFEKNKSKFHHRILD